MEIIGSHQVLKEKINQPGEIWLLLYKKGSEPSDKAFENIETASKGNNIVFTADVNNVRDIHPVYGVSTVPTLLHFRGGKLVNMFKGAEPAANYENILSGKQHHSSGEKNQKTTKSVIVYTTPTCSWCNTLKSYLKNSQIHFREIDVSRDEKMAQKMIQKSGQQGVPQTEINGQMVVGFDRNRIDQLLGIN